MPSDTSTWTYRRTIRTVVLVVGAFMTLMIAATSALGGTTIQAECEGYVDSYNIGGLRIHKAFCSEASEYYAADGVDVIGEWIEVSIFAPVTGYYEPTVGYQIEYEETAGIRLTVINEEGGDVNLVSDFTLTEGWGFG